VVAGVCPGDVVSEKCGDGVEIAGSESVVAIVDEFCVGMHRISLLDGTG
jgi:hypothetical protein